MFSCQPCDSLSGGMRERAGTVTRIDECGLVLEHDAMGYATTGKHLVPQKPDPAHGSTSACSDPSSEGRCVAGRMACRHTICRPDDQASRCGRPGGQVGATAFGCGFIIMRFCNLNL
ncbi:hypothetical protein PVAP13_9KG328132 [Panicum virgatum]|uniref:Uncharacterized protein n=1 Tax=Panicum virgatum TaxID=38727 RepID=A0A8T0NTN1_PANVG|nr:hypothetical protein PVAP13_9KG328132 [Panicum virgatum]